MTARQVAFLAVAVFVLAGAATLLRFRPPSLEATGEVSPSRTSDALTRFVGEGRPRPVGSEEGAAARARLIELLREAGYAAEEQPAFACGRGETCAWVTNVLARLPGVEPGPAVLVAAHYDSVGAGAGASDDGMGVAALLETARVLRERGSPGRDVIFLFSDGEEAGAVGGAAFAEQHPWATTVGPIVNVEARGTSGPVLLFETGPDNQQTISALAGELPHPVTSSLMATVYAMLPNETDFSVFRDRGHPGVNLAVIGDAARYHTPRDDLAHVNRTSLVHETRTVLSVTRVFAAMREGSARGDAVFFDVLSLRVVWWPVAWTWPGLALVTLLLAAQLALRPARRALAMAALGLVTGVLTLLLSGVLGAAAASVLEVRGALGPGFPPDSTPALACALCAAAVGALGATLLGRRAGPDGVFVGCTLLALAGAATALAYVPGVSYLLLVPVAPGVVCAAAWRVSGSPRWRTLAFCLPAIVSAALWVPVLLGLLHALGPAALVPMTVAAAVALLPVVPALAGLTVRTVALALTIGSMGSLLALRAQAVAPRASAENPSSAPLDHLHDPAAGDQLVLEAEAPTPGLHADFDSPVAPLPWAPFGLARPAATLDAPPPRVEDVTGEIAATTRTVRGRLRSLRGARAVGFAFPPGSAVARCSFEGQQLRSLRQGQPQWQQAWVEAVPPGGVRFEVVVSGAAPLEVMVLDATQGLPASDGEVAGHRRADGVTSQGGDRTLSVSRQAL